MTSGLKVRLTLISRNAKTGPIPVSTSDESTCPSVCPLKGKGCYARFGPLGLAWRAVDKFGMDWVHFCRQIAALYPGSLWRHNQAGDLPGEDNKIDAVALRQLVKANQGRRGFTYTHKPMNSAANRRAIVYANANGFTINLSANGVAHADSLAALKIAPIVTILPREIDGNKTPSFISPGGNKIVVCPATYRAGQNCGNCGLCQKQRSCIVGFPAHGAAVRMANETANSTVAT